MKAQAPARADHSGDGSTQDPAARPCGGAADPDDKKAGELPAAEIAPGKSNGACWHAAPSPAAS